MGGDGGEGVGDEGGLGVEGGPGAGGERNWLAEYGLLFKDRMGKTGNWLSLKRMAVNVMVFWVGKRGRRGGEKKSNQPVSS